MSELAQSTFLILDCQTTGMRPSVGHLLELGWTVASAEMIEPRVESSLVALPEEAWLPPRVSEVTGIYQKDLADAIEIEVVRDRFTKTLKSFGSGVKPVALVHYAQFEQPFLSEFLRAEIGDQDSLELPFELPFELLCTHKIAKKLYPTVPSRNIRGLTGFFGSRIGEIKRASQHVRATHLIWQGLVTSLKERGIENLADLKAFLAEVPPKAKRGEKKTKAPTYEYRVPREKRLALPDQPGIYKMKDKDGAILYVGKATSLKDRVNSYFRGKKGRDPRKLELMAQVWDLETEVCGSALEAALLESDEIKRLDPPYNVSLKGQNRSLIFYSRDFETLASEQASEYPIGPFRRFNSVEHLRVLVQGLRAGTVANVFYQPIEAMTLVKGFELFRDKYPEFDFDSPSIRAHLSYGFKLLRKLKPEIQDQIEDEDSEQELRLDAQLAVEPDTDLELTPEDLLEDFEHLYLRAAESHVRSKQLTKLLDSTVSWSEKGEMKTLSLHRGKVVRPLGELSSSALPSMSWVGLGITDFDRMSVLLSELSRFSASIEASDL